MIILLYNNDHTNVRFMEDLGWMPGDREIKIRDSFRAAGYKDIAKLKSKYL